MVRAATLDFDGDTVGRPTRRTGTARKLARAAAPVAAHQGGIIEDAAEFAYAAAVAEAFRFDAADGLTRAQIVDRVAAAHPELDRGETGRQLSKLVALDAVVPVYDKARIRRYQATAEMTVGVLIFDRLLSRPSAAHELIALLTDIRAGVESGALSETDVADQLGRCHGAIRAIAYDIARLNRNGSFDELVERQAIADDEEALLGEVTAAVAVVVDRYPGLHADVTKVNRAVEMYLSASHDLIARLQREGYAARDFSMLPVAAYEQLATDGDVAALASVFDGIVWDPPRPGVDPDALVARMREYRPARKDRRLPSLPAGPAAEPEGLDPVGAALDQEAAERGRLVRDAEKLLDGEPSAELWSKLAAGPWPGALWTFVRLVALAGEDVGYRLDTDARQLVDPDSEAASYLPGITLTADRSLPAEVAAGLGSVDAERAAR